MQGSWFYIQNSSDFIEKMKRADKIPKGDTANAVRFYPSIPHKEGLEAPKVRGRTFMKNSWKVSQVCLQK